MRFLPSFGNFKAVLKSVATTHLPNSLSALTAFLQLGSKPEDLDLRFVALSSVMTFLPGLSHVLTPNTDYRPLLDEADRVLGQIRQAHAAAPNQALEDMMNNWQGKIARYANNLPLLDHSLRSFYFISLMLSVTSTVCAVAAWSVTNTALEREDNVQGEHLNLASGALALSYASLTFFVELTLMTFLHRRTGQLQSVLAQLKDSIAYHYAVMYAANPATTLPPDFIELLFPRDLDIFEQKNNFIDRLTRLGDSLYNGGGYMQLRSERDETAPVAASTASNLIPQS